MSDFYSFSMLGKYGRLGNQMFQVAAMICLAKKNNVGLALPTSDIASIRSIFDIPCEDLNAAHIQAIRGRWQEPSFCFQPEIYDLPPCIDVLGYLQSWRYILYEEDIRHVFTFRHSTKQESLRHLPEGETISLHIRRGDYLKFPEVFPLPDVDYYKKSIEKVRAERPEAQPVVFTDDPDWCRAHFSDMPIFSFSEEQDLCMMSMCNHHIIANSSYSWWGAWLAKSDKQIVFTPPRWFGPGGPKDAQDLLPLRYLRA
jgi:hypothetical protein